MWCCLRYSFSLAGVGAYGADKVRRRKRDNDIPSNGRTGSSSTSGIADLLSSAWQATVAQTSNGTRSTGRSKYTMQTSEVVQQSEHSQLGDSY